MVKKKNKVVERTRRKNGEGSIYQDKHGRWANLSKSHRSG